MLVQSKGAGHRCSMKRFFRILKNEGGGDTIYTNHKAYATATLYNLDAVHSRRIRDILTQNHSKAGFTLLEVMLAITIFIVLIVMLFGALVQLYSLQSLNQQRVTAVSHAMTVVDELQGMNSIEFFSYIPPDFSIVGHPTVTTVEVVEANGDLTELPISGADVAYRLALPNPMEFRIRVMWIGSDGRDYSRNVTTMVHK